MDDKVIILQQNNVVLNDKGIEELEQKYTEEIGCKVVILSKGLEIAQIIDKHPKENVNG
jgi:hypothetical protein